MGKRISESERKKIERDVSAPRRTSNDAIGVNPMCQVPYDIACQHARMAACAMRTGEEAKAVRAVQRAFETARELSRETIGLHSHVREITGTRIANVLESYNVHMVGDLVQRTAEELLRMNGINSKSLSLIEESLAKAGLRLNVIGNDGMGITLK